MKILLMKLGAIGDVVHSTIITSAIKMKHPDWEVHYLTNKTMTPILENNVTIDKVYTYEKGTNAVNVIKKTADLISQLRAEKYDIIISLSYTFKLLLFAVGASPKKIGFRKYYKGKSWVEEYFLSAKKLMPDLEIPERLILNNNKEIEDNFKNYMVQYPKPHIFLSPGKSENQIREGRVWNIDKWKKLSERLLEKYKGTIFIVGSSSERENHLKLEKEGIIILSGLYNLEESCALLSLADLVISGDSGPVHIASAYDVKTISILGSTSPDKIKPYGKNAYVIEPKTNCRYCWKKKCKYTKNNELYAPCIESIPVDEVYEKVTEIL